MSPAGTKYDCKAIQKPLLTTNEGLCALAPKRDIDIQRRAHPEWSSALLSTYCHVAGVDLPTIEGLPPGGRKVAVESGLPNAAVDHVVHAAHPLLELLTAAHPRGIRADNVREVLGALGARVQPRQAVDEGPGIVLLAPGGRLRELSGQGVQKGPSRTPQVLLSHRPRSPVRGTVRCWLLDSRWVTAGCGRRRHPMRLDRCQCGCWTAVLDDAKRRVLPA